MQTWLRSSATTLRYRQSLTGCSGMSRLLQMTSAPFHSLPAHNNLVLRTRVLVHCADDTTQLVVPTSLQRRLFNLTHAGPLAVHLGPQRTLQQLQLAYYWPGMQKAIADCHYVSFS